MIQQHFLQQQRLNYNHDRLLERYHRLISPKITEFRTFGTSVLPGRNYDQYLGTLHGGNTVVTQSRASIGSSSETYRLMGGGGGGTSEILPRNVKSVMQHSRSQSVPLVHAEKFEPVQFYEHPRFGPTPSYLRPIINEKQHVEDTNDNDSDESEEETEVSSKIEHREETKSPSIDVKNDDHEESDRAPRGYISYQKWKTKYENLIPVNPLLFSIYTKRPNGSINKYGQSLYASPPRHRRSSLDEDIFTPTSSEIESISSEIPHETSLSSHRRYNRLQQQSRSKPIIPRSLEPIHTENESSDDESSPPDSPVPYLSRTKSNVLASTSIIPSTAPITVTPSALNTLDSSTAGLSLGVGDSKNTSNIPPAPPMPPSLTTTTTTSTTRYEKPSSISITSPSPPSAPPMPSFLTTSNSTAPYQAPSSSSVLPPPTPSVTESTTKAVTFAGVSSTPATHDDDVSSSSDSEDEEKQKRRRRRKRQAAGGDGNDSSSSDD